MPLTCDTEQTSVLQFMTQFNILGKEQVMKYILNSPSTTCPLDPIPTELLKLCLDEVFTVVIKLINQCLETDTVPSAFKETLVIPLIKKQNADIKFKNFKPISNLHFLSKVIERIVIDQMSAHCNKYGLNDKMQSAYRRGHSTEMALLKVCYDIFLNIDQQQVTIMALLDLSAAFDTVHHTIFLDRLAKEFGIEGTPLAWMASYLSNRTQQVIVNGVRSERVSLSTGFRQGGGAGQWAYLRYTQPVARIN